MWGSWVNFHWGRPWLTLIVKAFRHPNTSRRMPLSARRDRVIGDASLYPLQAVVESRRIAAHFVWHSSSHFCLQRWDFSWCSGLVLIFCPCLPTLSKLQSWPGRHISWFSEQPTLRSSASNLSGVGRVAQKEDMLSRLHTPVFHIGFSFFIVLVLQLSDRRIHRTISSDS